MRHPELLADLPHIARHSALVLQYGCAPDHLQICDPGQVRQNFVLHAIGEINVIGIEAQVFKRKHCDAFFGHRDFRRKQTSPRVAKQRQAQAKGTQYPQSLKLDCAATSGKLALVHARAAR